MDVEMLEMSTIQFCVHLFCQPVHTPFKAKHSLGLNCVVQKWRVYKAMWRVCGQKLSRSHLSGAKVRKPMWRLEVPVGCHSGT